MDFDLCNKTFTEWLLSYEENKRVHLITEVQEQLAQMGLSDDAMKRALTQISQNTVVQLCRLTSDDVKMYSNWYSGYNYYHGRYSEDGYRMSSYRNIHKSNHCKYTSYDRYDTSVERNIYSYKGETYHPRPSDYSRNNELENLCDGNVNGRRKSSHYRSSSPYKRKTLSPALQKVKKRVCYSYDNNDKIRLIGSDKHTAVSDRDTFLRERNTTTYNRNLMKMKTITSSKKDVKDSVRDKLDIVNKKSFPRVEKPDVDSHSKTDVKLNTYKSNSEGNTNKKTETSEIDSSNLTGISCEILQRDRNCNSENNAVSSKVKEEEKEETVPRMKEHSAPGVSDIPENVDVKCQKRPITSEVANRDSVIVVANQLSSINYNFHVPVIVKHSLPEVSSSPVQKSPVKIQSHKIGNDKVSKSKQLCEEKCSDDNIPSPRLSVTGGNILKTKQLCTSTSGCDKNSEKTIDSQQQYLISSDGKNKKCTGISSSRDAKDDISSEKMSEYDKYTATLLTTKKDNTRGIKRNEKIINESDKLRKTSKSISSKIITDGVKRTSPSYYITIDEYYKQKSSVADKDFSTIDNENKISLQKIVPLQRNSSVSDCQTDLNMVTESMQHLDKISTSERKFSVSQCKVVSKTSPDKKLRTLENAAFHHECKILKPDQRRSSAPVNGSDVNKKEHRKRRHSYNEQRVKSFKNLNISNRKNASNLKLKNFIKEDKNLQNTCTISALNPSVKNKHVHFFDKIERDISYLPESEIKLSGKKRKKIKDLFGDEEDFEESVTKKNNIERQESQFIQNEHSNIGVKALNSPLEIIDIQTHEENITVNVEFNMENTNTLFSSASDLVLNTLIPCHETYINKVGGECASLNETEKFDNSNNQNTKNNASCDGVSRSVVNKQIKCFDQKEQRNNVQTCVGELSNEYAEDLKIGSQVATSVSVKTKTTKSHQERKTCLNIQEKQDLNKMQTSENGSFMYKAGEQGASMKEIEKVCAMKTQSSNKMHQIVKEIYVGESISTKEMEKVSRSSENISDSSKFMTKSLCRPSDMEKQVEILNASTKVSVKTKISESDTVKKGTLTFSSNENSVQEKGNNKDVTEDNSLSRKYNRQVEISTRGEDSTEECNGKKNTSQILTDCTALNQIDHNNYSSKPSEVTEDTVYCNTTSHQEQGDNLIENEVLCNVSPQTDTDKKRLLTAMFSHSYCNDNSVKRASTNLDVSTENVKHSLNNSTIDSGQNSSVSKLPEDVSGFRCGENYQFNERNINLQNLLNKNITSTVNEKQNISNSGELNAAESSVINEKQNSLTPGEFNLSESSAVNKKQNISNPDEINISKSLAANKKQNMSIPDQSNMSHPSEYNNAASGAVHDDNRSAVPNATPTYRIKVRDPEFLGIRCERNIQSQSNVTQTITGMHQKSFSFQEMNKNLQELAEIIYTVLHDKDRCLQRKIAAYSLTDELKATEVSLATRDFYHSIDLKLKSFFKLYLYVENGLKYNAIETVLRRVNEISKTKQYSLTDLHSVIKLVLRQRDNKRSTENFHSNELASMNSNTTSNSTFLQSNTIPPASSLQSVPVQHVNVVNSEIMNHSDNGGTISHNLMSPHLSNKTVEFQRKYCDTVNTQVSKDTLSDDSRNRPAEKSSERSNPALHQSSSLMIVQPNHRVQNFDHSTNRSIVPNVVIGTPRFANHHSVIHHQDKQPNVNISNQQTQIFQQGVFHNTVVNTSNQVSHQQQQINETNNLGLSFSGRNEKDVQVNSQQGIESHSKRSLMEPLPSSGHIMTSSSVNCQQYPQELGLLLKQSKSGHVFDKRYEQQKRKQIQELQKQQQNHQSQQHHNQQQQTPKQLQIWQHPPQKNQQQSQQIQHNYEQNSQQVLHHYNQNLQHVQHNLLQNNKQLQLHYQQNPQQQIRLHYQQSSKQNPQQLSHYQQNNKQQNQQVQQMHHYQQNLQQQHYQQNLQQLKPNPQQMYQHYQQNHQQWSPQQMQQQLNQNQKLKQFHQWYQHKKQQLQREQRSYEIQLQKPSVLTSLLQPQSGHQPLSLPPPPSPLPLPPPPPPPLRQLQLNLRHPPPLLTKQQSNSQPISAPQTQTSPQSSLPPSQSQQILHPFLSSSNIHHLAFVPFQAQFLPQRPSQSQQQQPLPPPPLPPLLPPPPPPLPPPPSYESWQRETQQPAILLNSQICGQINSQTTTEYLVAKDSCQQNKTTNYQSVAKSFEREATEISSINQQISCSTDKDNIVVEQNNPNIKKINKQDVAKNHKETYSSNTSSSELDQGSAETEMQKPVPENQSTNSKLMTSVQGDGGENETNKKHQEQNMCLETPGKTSCRTTQIQDADNEQNQRISSCPSINNKDERNVHAQVEVEARDIGIQVSYPDPDTSANKDSENMNKKLDLCPGTKLSIAVEDFCDLTVQSPLPDIMLDQNDDEEDADIQVIGEFASQPRTISRDSGYTTPGPVGSFSFKEDQEGFDMTEEEETTWENYHDIFEVKDEISDWKPALQSEPEKITESYDSSDKTSVTWQKMEDVAIVALNLNEEIMCANCNKIAEVICTGCKNTCYCSEKCQLDHWNEVHHTVCCTPDIE